MQNAVINGNQGYKELFYCLVVGSRTFKDYDFLSSKLDSLLKNQDKVTIVSGGAYGADSLAEKYALDNDLPLVLFRANWDRDGNAAGFKRNARMHEYISQFEKRGCVAFWDGISKGTKHNFDLAKKYNTPLKIIRFQ